MIEFVSGIRTENPQHRGQIYDMNIQKLIKINQKIITTNGQSNRSDNMVQQKSYIDDIIEQKYIEKFVEHLQKYGDSIKYHILSNTNEYSCCKHKYDRDHNSDKNMLIKGLVINGYLLK